MLDKEQFEQIQKVLPVLQTADPQLTREFQETAYFAKIPSGRDIFVEGDQVDAIALLLSGAVRVYRIGVSGREITLYRFGGGESCILTANAILNHQAFPAIASVEQEAEAVMIPATTFHDWISRFDIWRDFVFTLFSQRLVSVMEIVDQVAFQRMDRRVAAMLLSRSQGSEPIQITHQSIADELGSSREVITRLLQDLAQQEVIRLSRGEIEILNKEALETIQTL
ncbi:MAG: Crp/Fnr family transcriptional regulator [Chloroflexi bacterium]|nr:MAG: Crp/Fnr family transcriptional regulator [Chloroflexota bacterium]MBL1196151.1 Crp/Fnr family transcriptional regulator [Chloroflexota bacterium]NOH13444.1 Crp/Fnr family transcriptional regulator [Chloroflexota bacterium]